MAAVASSGSFDFIILIFLLDWLELPLGDELYPN